MPFRIVEPMRYRYPMPQLPSKTAPTGFSQSLERGLQILASFTELRPVLGIADIARAVDLNKSTTYRYVATLAKLDYLQQDPETKKYALGPRVLDLGFAAINSMEITRIAGRYLQALSDETGYTVSMAVLDGTDIVYIDRRRSGRGSHLAMDLNLHVGSRLPAYCTSMGKVLLAYRDAATLRGLLDRTDLARRGPRTITAREQLMVALDRVRQNGFAVNDEELAPGLRSLAAPVRSRSGEVIAAVNIAVHLSISNASVESLCARLEPPLRRATSEISARLGYRRPE
jgi:IclR family pca regulon transcriptional regulator